MKKIEILEEIFDKKKMSILRTLVQNKKHPFYLQELARQASVPIATTQRILMKLWKIGVVEQNKVNRFKLYNLALNKKTKFLLKLLETKENAIFLFVNRLKRMSNVEEVLQKGEIKDNKVNLIIVGDGVASVALNDLAKEYEEKYNLSFSLVAFTREQFDQMIGMGLYKGEKIVLFKRE